MNGGGNTWVEPPVATARRGKWGLSLARAAVSSGAATLVDGAVYQLVLALLAQSLYERTSAGSAYAVAATSGAVFGAITNFSLNRVWVFRSNGNIAHEGLRYAVGSALTLLVLQAALWVLISRASLDARVAWLPAKLFAWVAFSYPFQRWFVFMGARR